MNEEELYKFVQARKRPINSMQDLDKRLIGTRDGFIFYTTSFRLDFENKMAMLGQLQNNWNELKNIIEQDIRQCEELIEMCPKELRNTIIGTRSYEEIIGCNKHILSKMQELEQGKDE